MNRDYYRKLRKQRKRLESAINDENNMENYFLDEEYEEKDKTYFLLKKLENALQTINLKYYDFALDTLNSTEQLLNEVEMFEEIEKKLLLDNENLLSELLEFSSHIIHTSTSKIRKNNAAWQLFLEELYEDEEDKEDEISIKLLLQDTVDVPRKRKNTNQNGKTNNISELLDRLNMEMNMKNDDDDDEEEDDYDE